MQQRIAFVTKTTSVALCEEPFIHKTSISRSLFEAQHLVGVSQEWEILYLNANNVMWIWTFEMLIHCFSA